MACTHSSESTEVRPDHSRLNDDELAQFEALFEVLVGPLAELFGRATSHGSDFTSKLRPHLSRQGGTSLARAEIDYPRTSTPPSCSCVQFNRDTIPLRLPAAPRLGLPRKR